MKPKKRSKKEHFQTWKRRNVDHCCVPFCSSSSEFNGTLSFHNFPIDSDLRAKWLTNILLQGLTITSRTKVCSKHFVPDLLTVLNDRKVLVKGAVPTIFVWTPCKSVVQLQHMSYVEHNYCLVLPPAAEEEDNKNRTEEVQEFGLERFAGCDAEIQHYTRFPSYDHLLAFWFLIEPCVNKMIEVSRANLAGKRDKEGQQLHPVDELFLFLMFLSVGLTEIDLAHRFKVQESTVNCIIATWTHFLASVLGSQCIWLTPTEVQAHLPEVFKDFPDTQVILDCRELRYKSSPSCESYFTMKALVGMAPHGAVMFISDLYEGSVSENEMFKQSGLSEMLNKDMAVVVNDHLPISDFGCKVYSLPLLSKQIPAHQVKEKQAMVRLRAHVKQVIRRTKQNRLFDGSTVLSQEYGIKQLFAVACLLTNYQNCALNTKR